MPGSFRKFTKRFLIVANSIVLVFFLTGCLSPYLNPSTWWFFGFMGLIFPYLLFLLLAFLILWLFIKPKWSLLSLLALVLGWKSISSIFAFNLQHEFRIEKSPNAVRVMTWNVRRFIKPFSESFDTGIHPNEQKMLDLIKEQNPDIICFQEFYTADDGKYADNIRYFTRNMGYAYHYFSNDWTRVKVYHSGTVIFSRFPIIDSGKISLAKALGDGVESLIYVDVLHNKDTLRIYTGHLQSFGFLRKDYNDLSRIKNQDSASLRASRNIFRKMRDAFKRRGAQADFIRAKLDMSPYPEVFCGDLNDVPNSYSYYKVKGDKKDSFIARGLGFGRTYYSFSSGIMRRLPTLRIDYIFADPRFSILQAHRIPRILSDHYPVVADLLLETK